MTLGFIVPTGESTFLTEWSSQAEGTMSMGYTSWGNADYRAPRSHEESRYWWNGHVWGLTQVMGVDPVEKGIYSVIEVMLSVC